MTRAQQDQKWADDAAKYGWSSAGKAALFWRVWGVRHIRWAWHNWRMARHYDRWASVGVGFGVNQSDRWALYGIYRGWL